jgi:hypothetical protein
VVISLPTYAQHAYANVDPLERSLREGTRTCSCAIENSSDCTHSLSLVSHEIQVLVRWCSITHAHTDDTHFRTCASKHLLPSGESGCTVKAHSLKRRSATFLHPMRFPSACPSWGGGAGIVVHKNAFPKLTYIFHGLTLLRFARCGGKVCRRRERGRLPLGAIMMAVVVLCRVHSPGAHPQGLFQLRV